MRCGYSLPPRISSFSLLKQCNAEYLHGIMTLSYRTIAFIFFSPLQHRPDSMLRTNNAIFHLDGASLKGKPQLTLPGLAVTRISPPQAKWTDLLHHSTSSLSAPPCLNQESLFCCLNHSPTHLRNTPLPPVAQYHASTWPNNETSTAYGHVGRNEA